MIDTRPSRGAGLARMRILVVAAEFPPRIGGVGAYTHALALGLQQAGAAVRVVTTWGDPSGNAAPGLAVTRTPEVLNRRYLKTLPLLVASIFHWLRDRPDWVVLMKCTHEGLVHIGASGLHVHNGTRRNIVRFGLVERDGCCASERARVKVPSRMVLARG